MSEPYGTRAAALLCRAALTVTGLLVLAGCGGGAEPPATTVTVTESPDAPGSSEPSETEATLAPTSPANTPEPEPSRKRPTTGPIAPPGKACPTGGGDPVEGPCPSIGGRVPSPGLTALQPSSEPPTSPSPDPIFSPGPPSPLQTG